jgi:hypothetical protein
MNPSLKVFRGGLSDIEIKNGTMAIQAIGQNPTFGKAVVSSSPLHADQKPGRLKRCPDITMQTSIGATRR